MIFQTPPNHSGPLALCMNYGPTSYFSVAPPLPLHYTLVCRNIKVTKPATRSVEESARTFSQTGLAATADTVVTAGELLVVRRQATPHTLVARQSGALGAGGGSATPLVRGRSARQADGQHLFHAREAGRADRSGARFADTALRVRHPHARHWRQASRRWRRSSTNRHPPRHRLPTFQAGQLYKF